MYAPTAHMRVRARMYIYICMHGAMLDDRSVYANIACFDGGLFLT